MLVEPHRPDQGLQPGRDHGSDPPQVPGVGDGELLSETLPVGPHSRGKTLPGGLCQQQVNQNKGVSSNKKNKKVFSEILM